MSKSKNAKSAAAANAFDVTAVRADFTAAAEKHAERFTVLCAVDCSSMGEQEQADHKAAMLAARNRRDRCNAFAVALDNEKFAAAFADFNLNAAACMALQIYAQDKLLATLRAVAANVALSGIGAGNHSNNMTQRLVEVLLKDGSVKVSDAPRRMHDLHSDKSMGTYSAQASSSRQVLELLGMVTFDALAKTFSLSERGQEYLHVISK